MDADSNAAAKQIFAGANKLPFIASEQGNVAAFVAHLPRENQTQPPRSARDEHYLFREGKAGAKRA